MNVIQPWKWAPATVVKPSDDGGGHVPVFIIGVPRSGTTLLDQVITQYLQVAYPDNLVHLYSGNLPYGMQKSIARYGRTGHDTFASNHGHTWRYSWHAPSEFTPFWQRFFSSASSHANASLSEEARQELRVEIYSAMASYGAPVVFKNLGLSLKVGLLVQLFPGAKFIHVRRRPADVISSIALIREQMGIQAHQWWSVKPACIDTIRQLPLEERIVKQVFHLRKEIDVATWGLGTGQLLNIQYEDFILSPDEWIETCRDFIGVKMRSVINKPFVSKSLKPEVQLTGKFKTAFESLEW